MRDSRVPLAARRYPRRKWQSMPASQDGSCTNCWTRSFWQHASRANRRQHRAHLGWSRQAAHTLCRLPSTNRDQNPSEKWLAVSAWACAMPYAWQRLWPGWRLEFWR